MHYKTFLNVKDKIVSKDENLIFYKLKDLKDVGNVITNAETPFNVLYISNKPPLMLKTIDYLPYHPYLVNNIRDIMTEVYGYDFENPPRNNYPYINDDYIKSKFEKRLASEWDYIKNKFKSNIVITPNNWKLDLELIFSDKRHNLYRIN